MLVGLGALEASLARRILQGLDTVGRIEVGEGDAVTFLDRLSAPGGQGSADGIDVLLVDADAATVGLLGSRLSEAGVPTRVTPLPRPVSAAALAAVLADDPVASTPDRAVASTLADLAAQLGGTGAVQELVELYVDALDGRWSEVTTAWETGDRDGVRRAAHTLKSSSALLGVTGLADLTRQLESLAESAPAPEVDRLVSVGLREVDRARAALAGWLARG